MNAKRLLAIRLILALTMSCGVAWLPLSMARGSWMQFSPQQKLTQMAFRHVTPIIEDYRKQHGGYPSEIQTLLSAGLDDLDGWKRPWVYSLSGGQPLVESLGRDGKRGGSGEDADLSNLAPRPDAARLSMWQRLIHREARMIVLTALGAGLIMGTLTFFGLKEQNFERNSLLPTLISLLVTIVLAAFGATFIAFAHIPSGH